jgi:alanine-alpha-ketoisovalerate/valine-pyruvate aminotransferase
MPYYENKTNKRVRKYISLLRYNICKLPHMFRSPFVAIFMKVFFFEAYITKTTNSYKILKFKLLDFKLSPCSECCMLSSG